jgi:hypothetical protein
MRFLPFSLRLSKIAFTFTAQLLLCSGILIVSVAAQQAAPQFEPPLPAAVFQNRIPSDRLAFLSSYAGQPAKELLKDKRFRSLEKLVIPRSEYHYGRDMPLDEASDDMLWGSKTPIDLREGRYLTISGRQGPYLDGSGFLWFDLQEGIALGGVYFHPVNGEPTPTLAIFSRQLTDKFLAVSQLPEAFEGDLIQWATAEHIAPIVTRYFIPENGKKYVLLHDEDYCAHADGQPAPPQNLCEQMNAAAADIDLSAAYFMQQSGNAANATAWIMQPQLVAWNASIATTCRVGGLSCSIRVTRQRTRAILRQQR